ncbi:uncharacterized protein LOC144621217 [Crassostrea virginica]
MSTTMKHYLIKTRTILTPKTKLQKKNCWRQVDGRFQCILCKKKLTTKQRVLTHLNIVHKASPITSEKKLYRQDSAATVPRSTAYRWRKKDNHLCVNPSAKRNLFHQPQFFTESESGDTNTGNSGNENVDPDLVESFSESSSADESNSLAVHQDSSENHLHLKVLEEQGSVFDQANSCREYQLSTEENIVGNDEHDGNETGSDLSSAHNFSDFETESLDFSPSKSCDFLSDSDDTYSNRFSDSSNSDSDAESLSSDGNLDLTSEIDSANSDIDVNMPEKEYQALSLLSCLLRNKCSASASKDIIDTLRKLFQNQKRYLP